MADRLVQPVRPPLTAVITPASAPRSIHAEPPPSAGLKRRLHDSRLLIALLAALTVLLHVAVNVWSPYGLHRDELLYLGMGRHLRFWAMDFPPAIALLAEVSRSIFGDSRAAIRLASAVAGAGLVVIAFVLARAYGGSRRAGLLAAGAVLASPLFLRSASLFQPVVFDQLWWTLGLAALTRIGTHLGPYPRRASARPKGRWATRTFPPETRSWIALGIAGGLGLLTKFSIAFFAAGVLAALLITPLRATLRTRWPWIAVAIAAVIGSASIVGQIRLGWPMFGQLTDLRASQLDRVGPLGFLAGQLVLGPAVALAALGLWHLLRDETTRQWRAVGWTCAVALLLLLAASGKAYYAGPVYPTLFAAGAAALEQRIRRAGTVARRRLAWAGAFAAIGAFGLATLPFGLPFLAPAPMARYAAAFGNFGTTTNTGGRLALPQDYADMLGWPEQAAAVADVLATLPADQRQEVVLVAGNYGEAGALDFYGPRLGLPGVVSPAGSYWFFGPGDLPGATVIAIGIPPAELRRYFRRVTPAARVTHGHTPWLVDEEREVLITVCEQPLRAIQEIWSEIGPARRGSE